MLKANQKKNKPRLSMWIMIGLKRDLRVCKLRSSNTNVWKQFVLQQ